MQGPFSKAKIVLDDDGDSVSHHETMTTMSYDLRSGKLEIV